MTPSVSRAPHVTTTICVTAAVLASLAPGLLPRSAVVQALVTGFSVACAYGIAALMRRTFSKLYPTRFCRNTSGRRIAVVVAGMLIVASMISADKWQTALRRAMNSAPTDTLYWHTVMALSVMIAVLVCRLPSWIIGRRLPPVLAIACVSSIAFVIPAGATPASALAQPLSDTRSGAAGSLIAWDTLDNEARRFVDGGQDSSTIRTYVGLESAATPGARARLAVDELQRAGGLSKPVVVLAVPTGSGWIDDNAMAGLDMRFGGDAAIVASQYSNVPSWQAFVFDRDAAVDATRQLLSELTERLDQLADRARPQLYIYGQSLGAVAGSTALNSSQLSSGDVCGSLWAGPPAGAVDTADATVIAHTSDPVVWWSASLLTTPPDLTRAEVDAPVPQWIPLVSFLQTTVDVVLATGSPAGHGHRYGTEQGTRLGACDTSRASS